MVARGSLCADYATVDSWTSIGITGTHVTPQSLQVLQTTSQSLQALQNNITNNAFNAKYTPPIQTWSNTFLSAGSFGPSGTKSVEEMPKGSAPVDRLKRALMIASGNHAFWGPMHQVTLAYAPGYVKSLSKLDTLKNHMLRNVCIPPSHYMTNANNQVDLYAMAIRAPNSKPIFTYMTFHSYEKYATALTLDMGEDMLVISNIMLFIASQHKEFSIGVIPCCYETPNVLKSVKEFLDGFCDINIKPLMANLVYEFMGNVIFLAPSKRIASLAKAVFDVKYITSMRLPKYKDEVVLLPNAAHDSVSPSASISPYIGASSPGISTTVNPYITTTSGALTYTSGNTSSTNLTWTKLTSGVNTGIANIKNYLTTSGASL